MQTVNKQIIGQLLLVFTCVVGDTTYPLALIHPYDAPTGIRRRKDKDLGLFRIRAKPRKSAEFISIHSIIRGALVAKDFQQEGDYLVIDAVDTDMFLRLKRMYPQP